MIDTKALRSRVLDLAIQGKLTEQLESDGTAEELWQQIQAEKQRLIKEGKLKKEKPLPEISEDEIPFEIPENWKWVRLDEVFTLQAGKFVAASAIHETESADNPFKCYGGNGIRGYVSEYNVSGAHALIGRQGALCGNINFAEDLFYATEHAVVVYHYANTDVKWVFHALKELNLNQYATSVAQPGLAVGKIGKVLLPLPPLAEQKRIVARVEEIFRLLDIIDAAQEQYAADAESLKAKLITLGIQGRLTEQLKSDGTADELYQQIQAEKQRLIKEGKLKKEKPLPEIAEDEIPFEIPENWKWVRLGEVCRSIMDGDHQPLPQTADGIPFLVISNVSKGLLDFTSTRHVSKEYFDSLSDERIAGKGDILFTVTGSFGIPVKVETEQRFCFQRHMALIKLYQYTDMNFLYHTLRSALVFKQCDDTALGVAQRTVGIKSLRNIVIPLPPLAEQKRIAETLERVLGVLG